MPHTRLIDRLPTPGGTRGGCAAGWRAAFAVLVIAGAGPACRAAESISGLGSAFRPQGYAEAPAEQKRAAPAAASLPGLRVVVVSRGSRSVASIDGQLVHVGDSVNNMRVTRIDTDGVTMAGKDGAREWLKVTPAVIKRPHPANKTSRVSSGDHQ